MQKLEVFQNTWAMERRRPDGLEWTMEERFRMVAEAGFDGMCIDMGEEDIKIIGEVAPFFKEFGLACSMNAFPEDPEGLKFVVEKAVEMDAHLVSINAPYFPFTPEEGAEFVRRSLDIFKGTGVPAYFETHRLTLTTDMLYTLQVMDLVPEMELTADLSHYVVAREFPWPVDDFHLELMDRVLRRTASLQGRVASREQVQIQVDFPQQQGWVRQFYEWWEQGMRYWRARASESAVLNFLCELGPPPYAITGADGYELSDRWQEALAMKDRVRALWSQVAREDPSRVD
jgi:hypothetical protein